VVRQQYYITYWIWIRPKKTADGATSDFEDSLWFIIHKKKKT